MKLNSLFVNIMIILYKKMLSNFNKLFLSVNNLLGLKSDRRSDRKNNIKNNRRSDRKNNIKNNSNDKQKEKEPKNDVEWGYFVDLTQHNKYLDEEVFNHDLKKITSYYKK